LSTERICHQSIDAGVGGDVDEVLVEFAPDNAECPLSGGVEHGGERNTDADEDEIRQRQTQYHRVGRRPQATVAGDSGNHRQVADQAEDGDDAEDDRNDATENPADPAVRRPDADVRRVGLISAGRVGRHVDAGARIIFVN